MKLPIFTGAWGNCHIQGIAVDLKKGYIYYSFTTKLIKATLDGEVVGSLDGLVGHLGCLAFNEADGCVYGSLEYKNDIIGRDIQGSIGTSAVFADAFYIARFDVDRIDKMDIPAANNDIMRCIYLRDVVADYTAKVPTEDGEIAHRYGCSGIDGVTFAPLAGKSEADGMYLYVSYGVYSDLSRKDNDHQVLLCYDVSGWDAYAAPLDQSAMHTRGPEEPMHKFFVYTGNTTYGVQNLEYDRHTNSIFMAVYRGKKPNFPNYDLFAIDLSHPAAVEPLDGLCEAGERLFLQPMGECDNATGICGWYFPYGSTGMFSFGDGRWLFSENRKIEAGYCSDICLYEWDGEHPFVKL